MRGQWLRLQLPRNTTAATAQRSLGFARDDEKGSASMGARVFRDPLILLLWPVSRALGEELETCRSSEWLGRETGHSAREMPAPQSPPTRMRALPSLHRNILWLRLRRFMHSVVPHASCPFVFFVVSRFRHGRCPDERKVSFLNSNKRAHMDSASSHGQLPSRSGSLTLSAGFTGER